MKKFTIVTCIYNSSPGSRMGGRGYGFYHYLAPFTNLLNIGANIHVFTDPVIGEQLGNFFEEHNFEDYKIDIYDLNQYRHSDKIYRIKEELGIINNLGLADEVQYFRNDRNHHICLSKVDFLLKSIDTSNFNTKYTFWVDGGLFDHGLIPETLGGMERLRPPDEQRLWPNNTYAISNPDFFPKLINKTSHGLVLLGLANYHSRPLALNKFFKSDKVAHIVGGLFGGENSLLESFCKEFQGTVDCLFEDNLLYLEEEILSGVFADKFLDQGFLPFTHWSHDRPEEPNWLEAPPGSDSFYKLFL